MATKLTADDLIKLAAKVLDIESRAVQQLGERLDDSFTAACELCLDTAGRVVVTGMGKVWPHRRQNRRDTGQYRDAFLFRASGRG